MRDITTTGLLFFSTGMIRGTAHEMLNAEHTIKVTGAVLRLSILHELDDRAQLRLRLLLFCLAAAPLALLVLDLLQHLHHVHTLERLLSDFFA